MQDINSTNQVVDATGKIKTSLYKSKTFWVMLFSTFFLLAIVLLYLNGMEVHSQALNP